MAERKQTRAERKQAGNGDQTEAEPKPGEGGEQPRAERKQAGGGQRRAERKQAGGGQRRAGRKQPEGDQQTRSERKQARGGRRQRRTAEEASPPPTAELESRLARIEEAVASQSERSEELLGKLDEVLAEARKSARHAKTAVAQSEDKSD